ncbi:Asp23/Gls24 family envelope stress response protein [Phytohabitans suffuscus]|uniref:Stress protein n=1 Tax=Phytohabitans suffuscus TaxID=624315 RepID=A0A6F8YW39_9ACTN|nr:Asp23/Gls24 family envelope stress response protein [Phytohabitans suffuscus]BCB90071.1 stress protein [Phytohabitans suffuscus]
MAEMDVNGTGSTATASRAPVAGASGRPGGMEPARSQLVTEEGKTRIAEGVVGKIAGLAAREIPGVHSMGSGVSRRIGQLRSMMPGGVDASRQGVSVEVGEKEAAIDLDLVTWYGQSIVDVCEAVRRNVRDRVESMTGLKVVEVNITVDDVYVEGEQDEEKESRVR